MTFSSGESLYLNPDNREITFFYGNENFTIDKFIPTAHDILIYNKETNSIKCISREANLVTDEFCISDLFHSNSVTNVEIKNRKGKIKRKTIETIRFNSWYMVNDSVLYAGIFRQKKEVVALLIKVRNHRFIPEPVPVKSLPLIDGLVQTMPDALFGLRKILFSENFKVVSLYTNAGPGNQHLDVILVDETNGTSKSMKSFVGQSAVNNLDIMLFSIRNELFVKPLDSDTLFVFDTSGLEIRVLRLQDAGNTRGNQHWSVYADVRGQHTYVASYSRDVNAYLKLYGLQNGITHTMDSFPTVSFSVHFRDLCVYDSEVYFMLENKRLLTYDIYKMPLLPQRSDDTVTIHFSEPHPEALTKAYVENSITTLRASSMDLSGYKIFREVECMRYLENFGTLQNMYPQTTPREILTSVANAIKSNDLGYMYACLFAWDDIEENSSVVNGITSKNIAWLPNEITDQIVETLSTILSNQGINPDEYENERSFEVTDENFVFSFIKIRKKWYMVNSIQKKIQ